MKLEELKELIATDEGLTSVLNKVNDSASLTTQLEKRNVALTEETNKRVGLEFKIKASAEGLTESQIEQLTALGKPDTLLEMDLTAFKPVVTEIAPATPQPTEPETVKPAVDATQATIESLQKQIEELKNKPEPVKAGALDNLIDNDKKALDDNPNVAKNETASNMHDLIRNALAKR
jgi:hypothetical protein